LADIVVACSLVEGYRTVLDSKIQKPFKNLLQWFKNIASQGPVAGVLGEVILAGEQTPCNIVGDAGSAGDGAGGDDDDDEFDVFGDDDEDDEEREVEIQRIADAAKAAKEAKGKTVIERSVVVLDVKPWDSETDLDALEEKIRGIEMEGLEWKSVEKKPIAFGIFKLCIMCHIVSTSSCLLMICKTKSLSSMRRCKALISPLSPSCSPSNKSNLSLSVFSLLSSLFLDQTKIFFSVKNHTK